MKSVSINTRSMSTTVILYSILLYLTEIYKNMLKKLIEPLQKILLQKGICPACTTSLKKSQKRIPISQKIDKVLCSCGQEYFHDKELNTYSLGQAEEEE